MTKKTLPPESKFVHELRESLEHYAAQDGGSAALAPTMKIQGSAAMSSVPDIFGYYKGKHFWMECKRREIPVRKFDLMTDLTPGQRTVLRSWTMASESNSTFLAVRLGYDMALVVDFGILWRSKRLFPSKIIITPLKKQTGLRGFSYDDMFIGITSIHRKRKPRGLWENIGDVIGDGENE